MRSHPDSAQRRLRLAFLTLLALGLAPTTTWAGPTIGDTDGDGIDDLFDNCTDVSNTSQYDADGDGCGNMCDADYDDTNVAGISDFVTYQGCFGQSVPAADPPDADPTCAESDMDGSGVVGIADFVLFVGEFGTPPGRSLSPIRDPSRCSD